MLHRKLWTAGVLALGSCGGLAADGHEPTGGLRGGDCAREDCAGGLAGADGALEGELGPAPERGVDGVRRPGGVEPEGVGPGVGDACGPSSSQSERVTIGEIVLEASESCGGGHLCLMWAGADPACLVATDGPGCDALDRDDEFVPVPPVLAPEPPALDRVCTCRCGGAGGGEVCSCPEGMSCRELIRSSGVNGAAAEFVGSYCLY